MAEYTYDEEGFNFFYFLISVLSLCLVPVTIQTIYSGWQSSKTKASLNHCECETCQQERAKLRTSQMSPIVKQLTRPKHLFLIAGWIAVALLAYQVSFAEAPKQHWDPYEILGINEGATPTEIRKMFRKLSLVYHPDKAQPGMEKESEDRFVEIRKAYLVLTDDEARKNYEMYGHPDGKQSFSMGVALPKKLVEGGNSAIVMVFYACVFGLALPFYIARWWYRSRRQTKDKILNSTMRVFVKELKETTDFKGLIGILAGAHEFKENAAFQPGDEAVLKALDSSIAENMENRYGEKFERSDKTVPDYRRKARSLLFAYFLRLEVNSKDSPADSKRVLADQQYIVERSVHLLQGLLQIAIVKQWLGVAISIMDMQQSLFQASYPGEPSVKQLPHITAPLLRRYYRSKRKHIHSIQQLLAMTETERKSLLSPLTESQYLDIMEVANRVPKLSVCKAVFRVVGDKIITSGAVITFVLKLKNGAISVSTDTTESDDEELLEEEPKEKQPTKSLPLAHTPYYPGEKKPYWWIFLGDPKVNRILVPPRKVTDITDEQTIRIPFPGPPKPGVYTFSLFVKSDTYAGTDLMQDINLTIHDQKDLPPEEEVDDSISDPEEDSIAGQMKLMREQGLASALAGGSQKAAAKDDSDSDSSDDE